MSSQAIAEPLVAPVSALRAERHAPGRVWRRLRRNAGAILGLLVLLFVAVAAVSAPLLAPADPSAQEISRRLTRPLQAGHLLGTDQLGRDILSRIIYGSRVSLIVGFVSVTISGVLGTTIGLVAGYYRGTLDDAVGWLANVQLSFPFILLAIAVVAVLGAGLRNVIVVLGITGWVVYLRIARGEVLAAREMEYVQAARSIGLGNVGIMLHHILPNIMTPLIVVSSFEVARVVILEASLSFLGLGVQPTIPSWGSMLADGRDYLPTAPWLATFPGLAIMLTVLGINLFGDWLRDELDPRLTL